MKSGEPTIIPVSVIVPCYRCKETIERAVNSILAQTWLPEEIVLVDDASGDGTRELLKSLMTAHGNRIKVLSLEQNSGPGLARNKGWEHASQPWLAFLDSDDIWHPNKLEIQYRWIKNNPDAVLVGHLSDIFNGNLGVPISNEPPGHRLKLTEMLRSNQIFTRTAMIRRDVNHRFGVWRFSEDYFLWLSLISEGYPAYRLEEILAFYYRPEYSLGGLSGKLWEHEKGELHTLRELQKNGKLTTLQWISSTIWSLIKFIRRATKRCLAS